MQVKEAFVMVDHQVISSFSEVAVYTESFPATYVRMPSLSAKAAADSSLGLQSLEVADNGPCHVVVASSHSRG